MNIHHYDDVSLLTIPAGDMTPNIMHKLKFYYSHRYNNWVFRIPPQYMSFEYTQHILAQVENAHASYMKRYKMLPQKSEVQRSLVPIFDAAKLPNEICEKISSNVTYDCTCQNNIVCLMCAHACCSKARQRWCVCTVSFDCEIHGSCCVGTHD